MADSGLDFVIVRSAKTDGAEGLVESGVSLTPQGSLTGSSKATKTQVSSCNTSDQHAAWQQRQQFCSWQASILILNLGVCISSSADATQQSVRDVDRHPFSTSFIEVTHYLLHSSAGVTQ